MWGYVQIPVLALSAFGGLMWMTTDPWELLAVALWIGPLRLLWALHAQCAVNSICHLGTMTADKGSSRNVWWLMPVHMGQGENWHANHHRQQVDPRLGYGWQMDIGWWTILLLKGCRLAKRVRDPLHSRGSA
jgi:fatty-acid desaturase